MLDLFTIFTKGGIVLWCYQGTGLSLTRAVNNLIKTVILQERGGGHVYESLKLQFSLDNEFELVFVVAYQKILQLSYVDKLLQQCQLVFRDKYKNDLRQLLQGGVAGNGHMIQLDFGEYFHPLLRKLEDEARVVTSQPRQMRQFSGAKKGGDPKGTIDAADGQGDDIGCHDNANPTVTVASDDDDNGEVPKEEADQQKLLSSVTGSVRTVAGGVRKPTRGRGKKATNTTKSPKAQAKPTKEARQWDGQGTSRDAEKLNYSVTSTSGEEGSLSSTSLSSQVVKGSMTGQLATLEHTTTAASSQQPTPQTSNGGGGILSFFKGLTGGGKTITRQSMAPVLEKMTEHLIAKNVAAEIVDKLCESVATKLDGKVIGTFSGVTSTVKACFEESLVQILSPRRRIDVLREVMLSRERREKPYVITFCGVNGVGKSTNLAKVCFWLLDNGYRVLIAACDTFRSGAVEQLRTHVAHLISLHPPQGEHGNLPNAQLFERGYGKDPAGIAMEAILYAGQQGFDVVLVDTAGRMQNNEPLMIALAKLISVNQPDLVLFVGEALVGNEAVDQLMQFNRALRDHATMGGSANATPIDGILLTKFDTIDDKVGAAISMTYTTGQPIVFVGTGQTYTDLKTLNVSSVISALLN